MTKKYDPTQRCDDMNLLCGLASSQFAQLEKELKLAHIDGRTPTLFLAFETYRHPLRQKYLHEVAKTTRAGPFKSPHQFGLAVDFVPWVDGTWSWKADHDWPFLSAMADHYGLTVPIKWDLAHVEHPRWNWIAGDLRF